jgi:hypothetical protein
MKFRFGGGIRNCRYTDGVRGYQQVDMYFRRAGTILFKLQDNRKSIESEYKVRLDLKATHSLAKRD